jgi:hypothetical protein
MNIKILPLQITIVITQNLKSHPIVIIIVIVMVSIIHLD